MSEMPPWLFNGEPITEDHIKNFDAFVYIIIDKETQRKYIGKKKLFSLRKVKNKKNRQRSNSDWKTYWSSSDELNALIKEKGHDKFERHVLIFCTTWGDAGYLELLYQYKYNVLEADGWINNCIGKYRRTTKRIIEGRSFNKNFKTLLD